MRLDAEWCLSVAVLCLYPQYFISTHQGPLEQMMAVVYPSLVLITLPFCPDGAGHGFP